MKKILSMLHSNENCIVCSSYLETDLENFQELFRDARHAERKGFVKGLKFWKEAETGKNYIDRIRVKQITPLGLAIVNQDD